MQSSGSSRSVDAIPQHRSFKLGDGKFHPGLCSLCALWTKSGIFHIAQQDALCYVGEEKANYRKSFSCRNRWQFAGQKRRPRSLASTKCWTPLPPATTTAKRSQRFAISPPAKLSGRIFPVG